MALRVVVAGGNGFIGQYVVKELLKRRYRVRIVDRADTRNTIAFGDVGCEFFNKDLRNRTAAIEALRDTDVCICLAARSSGIGFFNEHPGEMLDDNLRILSAVFEAARINQTARMVYVSSSCVFDHSSDCPITESSLQLAPPPASGYPFSKLAGEFYCDAFYKQFGLSYTIVRPFNVYGPGEFPGKTPGDSHVIPDLTAKILAGQYPLEILGNGAHTRSFTHVRDIAEGIVLAMEKPEAANQDFNLGPPLRTVTGEVSEISILTLAQKLWTICGRGESFDAKFTTAYRVDVKRRAVDIAKAKNVLAWEPKVDLDSGLKEFVDWIRASSP